MKVLIIGGGAAGMAAAVRAAEMGAEVTLLERMDRVGKKLLATGNGRCNLMNTGAWRYPGGEAFARAVLESCGPKEQTAFWQRLGLRLRQEEGGRVYPVSGQASTVLDTLRLAMDRLGVKVVTGAHVSGIRHGRKGFTVQAGEEPYRGDRLIVACGGCAQPKLGSDGSMWPVLQELGHPVVAPRPALTQIITDAAPVKGLSGIRVKAQVSVFGADRVIHREAGEVLFTDYGLSGVCVMQCARYAEKGGEISLNFLPDMGFSGVQEAAQELMRRRAEWGAQPMENLLTGLCVPRLASCLCQQAGVVWKNRTIEQLKKTEIAELAATLGGYTLQIKGVKGFENAQVTSGGLNTAGFDPKTLESRRIPGLYAAGETLDVDGDCGGFNLMFAFGSGLLAAENCVKGAHA